MQKTVLAVALASVFSMGSAYAAPELSGTSSSSLGEGDYVLTGNYTIESTGEKLLDGANSQSGKQYPIHIDLNGHELHLISTDSVRNLSSGLMHAAQIEGSGKIFLHQKGVETALAQGGSSLRADLIDIRTEGTYAIYADAANAKHILDGNTNGVINVISKDNSAIYVRLGSVDLKNFKALTIATTSEKDNGYAISNNGGKLNIQGGDVTLKSDYRGGLVSIAESAKTKIDVQNLTIDSTIQEKSTDYKKAGLAVTAGSFDLTVANNLTVNVTAKEGVTDVTGLLIKGGKSNVTAGSTTINGDVKATAGELTLKSDALTVNGNVSISEAAKAPLTFSGANSALNGAATVEGSDNAMAFRAGARWVVKDESSVSNLVLDSGKVDLSQTDKNVTADKLTGKAGEVVLDAKGENTFTVTKDTTTKVTAVSSENADKVSVEEAKGMIDRIGGKVTDKNAFVAEGDYNGAISIDNKGNQTVHANTLMEDTLTLGGSSLLSLNRILMNDVRKRMGDVRAMEGTTGVWARYDGGRLSATGLENDFTTIQVGGDTLVPNTNFRVGLAASYTKGDNDFRRGSADLDAYMLTGYGLWMADNGMFADIVARIAKAENDMKVDGGTKTGKLDNTAYSLSGEFGWRFDLSNQYYVEPQAELTYTYINSEDLDLGVAQYKFDSMTSFLGRVGVATGIKCPNNKGDVYFRVSAVHEFDGDAKIIGANGTSLTQDGKDSWIEYGIGANFNLTPTTYFWGDLERTAGATLETDWRMTVGVRHAF